MPAAAALAAAIPFEPQSVSVVVGDAIAFKYGSAHNVYLVTGEGKWYSCDKSGGMTLAGRYYGGGTGSGYLQNLYQATATRAGTLYVVCGPHCSAGQKVEWEGVSPQDE